jgi:SOS-response transcriptional repressor LexA
MREASREQDRKMVNYILDHVERYGFPPSRRQIAEHMERSLSRTQKRMERLVREGVIERAPGSPRAIRINRDRLYDLEEFDG